MPTESIISGPKIDRGGEKVTPLALVATCEHCGAPAWHGEGVSLLRGIAGRWWCGWSAERGGYCKAAE